MKLIIVYCCKKWLVRIKCFFKCFSVSVLKNNSSNNFFKIPKQIDISNFKLYKSFFIFKNLKKENSKYKYLFKNVISETLFLIFTYKILISQAYTIQFDHLISQKFLAQINLNWFRQLSDSLKNNSFEWSLNKKIYLFKFVSTKNLLKIQFFRNKIIQKAFFLIFLKIYETKLNYFSEYSYSFRLNKSCHSALLDIKYNWHDIHWYFKFNLQKAFYLLKKNKLIKLLKKDIKDSTLFLLFFKLFTIWDVHKNFVLKEILFLFLNICLTPLDNYVEKIIKKYFSEKRLKNQNLINNDNNLIKIKYIRYNKSFLLGFRCKKKIAMELKKKILNFIDSKLFLEIENKNIKFINLFNNSVNFLSCKISFAKKKILSFFKNKDLKKKFRVVQVLQKKQEIKKKKNLKHLLDKFWNHYKLNSNIFLATMYLLKTKNFRIIRKSFLNNLKLSKKLGIKNFIKFLLLRLNFNIKNKIKAKYLFKKLKTKENIIQLILKYYDFLSVFKYKARYLVRKFEKKFSSLIWPIQVFRLEELPISIKFKSIFNKNKINFILDIMKTFKYNFKNRIMLKNNNFKMIKRQNKFILNASLKSIYLKLKKMGILQQTKLKIETKKSLLSLADFKIIIFFSSLAKNILYYFVCCNNFFKIKSIIEYYIKLSLASTLKQKHKISSINKVFKIYGKNISVIHPYKKNYKISFITKLSINNWSKNFIKKKFNTINNLPFKNIYKMFRPFTK